MEANDESPSALKSQSLIKRLIEIALIVLVFFSAVGVPTPNVNETHYLTKAKHYWHPNWCPGDLFLESADAHLVFYWTIGLLTKWFSLPVVAWTGRLLAWSGLAWSWQRLSWRMAPRPGLSVVTALLLVVLIDWCNLAGEWVVGGVEGKCFAYIFVFGALAELAIGRWFIVWPLLGLASAFHVLVGGWSVIGALGVWLLEPREERPDFTRMAPSLLLGGMLALPGVIPGLMLTIGASPEVRSEANQIYVFERLPHHLALHRLPAQEILRRFARFGLLLAGFAGLYNYLQIQRAYLPRLNRIQRFAWASVAICSLGLVWELATIGYPSLSASLLKYYWYRLSDVAVPLAVALSLGAVSYRLAGRPLANWLVVVSTLVPALLLFATANERWYTLTAVDSRQTRSELGWQDACRWAKKNTSPDALFMIPRNAYTFRWYAERAVFFTWKDVPQDAASQVVWWARYREAYYGAVNEFGEFGPYGSIQELGPERILRLAAIHGIDYVLTSEYPPMPLPIAYENPWYKIYDLRNVE